MNGNALTETMNITHHQTFGILSGGREVPCRELFGLSGPEA